MTKIRNKMTALKEAWNWEIAMLALFAILGIGNFLSGDTVEGLVWIVILTASVTLSGIDAILSGIDMLSAENKLTHAQNDLLLKHLGVSKLPSGWIRDIKDNDSA